MPLNRSEDSSLHHFIMKPIGYSGRSCPSLRFDHCVSHSCFLDLVFSSTMWPLWPFWVCLLPFNCLLWKAKRLYILLSRAPLDSSFPTEDRSQLFLLNEIHSGKLNLVCSFSYFSYYPEEFFPKPWYIKLCYHILFQVITKVVKNAYAEW